MPFTYALINPASTAAEGNNYADDGLRLPDGNAGDDLNWYLVTGFPASNAGSVTLTYDTARLVRLVDIWLVNKPTWGVLVPGGLAATVNGSKYAMPCIAQANEAVRCRAVLPATKTGAVKVTWPIAGASTSWVMVAEVAAAA